MGPPHDSDQRLAPPPRAVPTAFRLAEVLPFRWWYLWTLFVVAVAPIALWIQVPKAFAVVAVLTLTAIYGLQLCGARTRIALLRWGRPATVTDVEKLSQTSCFGATTWYNVYLPVAHGWNVTRQRWSGRNAKTAVRYLLDGRRGQLVVRGREYVDGVILADHRDPARARCVTSFAYDLDRDETGNWAGGLRPRLRLGMACWLVIVLGWLALAGVAAAGPGTDFSDTGSSPSAPVPKAGTLQASGTGTTKTIPCNDGYLSVSGKTNVITVTGHCTSVSVSGNGNHVAVDSADAVSTSGSGNVVTYHWGSPKIVNAGTSNTVRQG